MRLIIISILFILNSLSWGVTGSSPITVKSIAALRALAPGAYQSVILDGYYSSVSGGGGTLHWDASSSALPDSCITYKPGSNPPKGRWIRNVIGYIAAQGCGAYADGIHDDTPALRAGLAIAHNQFTGIGLDLGSGDYKYNKTLTIRRRVLGHGWRLMPAGGGSFDTSQYTATTAPTKVSCTVVIQDGGVLEGGVIQSVDTSFDKSANAGIWYVNLESNFGGNPMHDVRLYGVADRRFLNGVISRYNTTSEIGPFGGAYFTNGFEVDACNITNFHGIYFEHLHRGGTPFYFTNSSHNTVDGIWTEANANNSIGFWFDGVSNYKVHGLQMGDPDNAPSAGFHGSAFATGDTITQDTNYTFLTNDRISFDTVVAGINTGVFYYVISATSTTFKISLTSGGAAVNITANGSVRWRSSMQNAVRFTSCDRMTVSALSYTPTSFVNGVTLVNGSSTNLLIDDTYFASASAYGMWSQSVFANPNAALFRNVNVADTSVMLYVGRFLIGERVSFQITAHTNGLLGTDGGLNIYKLTTSGFLLKGTLTPGVNDLNATGKTVTLSFDEDAADPLYIAPITPSGAGSVDITATWNAVSGL